MKIGLTYDLRDEYLAAGYDEEATAEFDRRQGARIAIIRARIAMIMAITASTNSNTSRFDC